MPDDFTVTTLRFAKYEMSSHTFRVGHVVMEVASDPDTCSFIFNINTMLVCKVPHIQNHISHWLTLFKYCNRIKLNRIELIWEYVCEENPSEQCGALWNG